MAAINQLESLDKRLQSVNNVIGGKYYLTQQQGNIYVGSIEKLELKDELVFFCYSYLLRL
jgi:hypothetical protein